MNETFKTELAAFARDLKAMCDENPHTCQYCPLTDADGYCKGGLLNSVFDPEAVIAAVEAYRKRKKPCAEVIDRALDIYTIEVQTIRDSWYLFEKDVKSCAEDAAEALACHLFVNECKDTVARVLSAKRFVLESHRESDRESDREDAE